MYERRNECMPCMCIPLHATVCSALRRIASMDRGRRTLRAEELAGDVQGLASHNDDLLAVEQLLGDRGGQATEKVTLAVDDLRRVLAGVVALPLWWLAADREETARRRQRVPYRVQWSWCSCGRGVRTMTGSNVDMAAAGVVSLTVEVEVRETFLTWKVRVSLAKRGDLRLCPNGLAPTLISTRRWPTTPRLR